MYSTVEVSVHSQSECAFPLHFVSNLGTNSNFLIIFDSFDQVLIEAF